jgi:tetratricopeptide (TPR) repeat protein
MLFMSAMREPIVARTVYQYLSLSNLGISFRHLKRFAEAKDVLLQSIAFLKAAPQVHDGMLASLHREAALCAEALEQTKEAEDLLQLSLHYYEQHGFAKQHANKTPAAAAAAAAGNAAEAQEQRKLVLEQAGTHYSLALLLHKTGLAERAAQEAASGGGAKKAGQRSAASQPPRLREALRHYKDALRLMRITTGTDVSSPSALLLAPVLASQGALQSELGDPASDAAAQASVLEALDIYKTHNDPRLLPLLDVYMQMLAATDPALQAVVEQAKKEADAPSKPSSS